jgi:DnaK suppressor protein
MKRNVARPLTQKEYGELLLAKKAELLQGLGVESPALVESDGLADDDRAPLLHEQFIALEVKSLDYQTLKRVDAALDRIATGDYGVCVACGKDISPKRLAAIPWAHLCIDCQEKTRPGDDWGSHERAA